MMYGRHHNPAQPERVKCPGCDLEIDEIDLQLHALELLHQLKEIAMTTQDSINTDDALVKSLVAVVPSIVSGIDALKGAAGGTADTSQLDADLASLQTALNGANTDANPTPAAPVDTTPVDATPVDPNAPAAS